jgi:hypothetical protein
MRKIINKKEFIDNFQSGLTLKQMAAKYGISAPMIRYYLLKLGIQGRGRGKRKIIFIDKENKNNI